ncbi:MAG TPA: hypothetical protein DCL42_05840 [Deltaproteobacteria bacterium]|nr:hypothetical protein [Deltaproteobacteria bacterium]
MVKFIKLYCMSLYMVPDEKHIYDRHSRLINALNSEPKEMEYESHGLGVDTKRLISSAHENNHILFNHYGENPKVIILAYYENESSSQERNSLIIKILKESLNKNEILTKDNQNTGRVESNTYKKNGLIRNMILWLEENNIKTLLNDDWEKKQAYINKSLNLEKYINGHPENDIKFILEYQSALVSMCQFMCRDKDYGIINLVKGKSPLTETDYSGRLFQLTGPVQAYADIIGNELRNKDIPYMTFVPQK